MQFSGKLDVTTDPAPIIVPSPILHPGRIIAFEPIHTFFPIKIG